MSAASGALDVSFAQGALRTLGFFHGLQLDQAYDYMFEECRHILIHIDSTLSARGRLLLRPALGALTALQVDAKEPVGTGVLWSGARCVHSFQDWRRHPEEHVKIMRSLPNLLLLCRPDGPFERAVHYLRDMMQRGYEDPALLQLCFAS